MTTPDTDTEDVCAMDATRGPLVVRATKGTPQIRLALRDPGSIDYLRVVEVTYDRTPERDGDGRPIYR